jgi:SAM-dependent methyltransferase
VEGYRAFAESERIGWADVERASAYVTLFARASDEVVQPLLSAAGVKAGDNVLDLCCGQGNVAEALVKRGCKVTGVDFSSAMLELARRRVRDAAFINADVQDLPFQDDEFDAVVSNFGICHVPDQKRALAEVKRVLRPNRHFSMTVWCGPDLSQSYELVYRTIRTHGAPGVTAPAGPDFHQFANRAISEEFLSAAGLSNINVAAVSSGWTLKSPREFFDIFARGTVRAAMLLARQPPENLAAICQAMTDEVEKRFRSGSQWRVPTMAVVVSATA